MMRDGSTLETEVKLRVPGAAAARALLEERGYSILHPRALESNAVYDDAEHSFRRRGELIRIRHSAGIHTLTFKSTALPGRYKLREEFETSVGDASVLETILERLGLAVVFRYEKYRAEYQRGAEPGIVTVDETPIGDFLELEGPAEWIDAAAADLGFPESDYILSSYGSLYFEYCRWRRIEPGDMLFDSGPEYPDSRQI